MPLSETIIRVELVVHEVGRPAGISPRLDQDGRTGTHRLAATSASGHCQSFLAIEPVDAKVVKFKNGIEVTENAGSRRRLINLVTQNTA